LNALLLVKADTEDAWLAAAAQAGA
jgi:hypothetical protein